jgi:hypothetical protein
MAILVPVNRGILTSPNIFISVRFPYLYHYDSKACFKRRASHVRINLKTIDNQLKCLIIYCF